MHPETIQWGGFATMWVTPAQRCVCVVHCSPVRIPAPRPVAKSRDVVS